MTPRSSAGSYRTILVLTDASRAAESAVDVAAELAARSGATLHVAAAVQPDGAKVDLGGLTAMTQPGTREFATHLQEHVDAVSVAAREQWGCAVEAAVLTAEDPADGLTEYQRRVGVDLTVIGVNVPDARPPGTRAADAQPAGGRSRDRADLTRHLAYDVERRLPSPLLLLPGDGTEPGGGGRRPRSTGRLVVAVLGPYDTTAAATLPAQAAAFAAAVGSGLLLVDSVPCGVLPGQDRLDPALSHPEEQPAETRERLRTTARDLGGSGLKVEHEVVDGADTYQALVRLLRERKAGTLAVGPEGRAVIERLLHDRGSAGAGDPPEVGMGFAVLVCPAIPAT